MSEFIINDNGVYYKDGNTICKYDNVRVVTKCDIIDEYESKLDMMELVTFGLKNNGDVVAILKDIHGYAIIVYDKDLVAITTIHRKNKSCKDIYTSNGFIVLESDPNNTICVLYYDDDNRIICNHDFTGVSADISFDKEQPYICSANSFVIILEGKVKRMLQIPANICCLYNVEKKSILLNK